jgi:hypothetical protein
VAVAAIVCALRPADAGKTPCRSGCCRFLEFRKGRNFLPAPALNFFIAVRAGGAGLWRADHARP